MSIEAKQQLIKLYKKHFGHKPLFFIPLPVSGSGRQYFRIGNESNTVIGTFNHNTNENHTFFYMANHFAGYGLPVPQILAVDKTTRFYLQSDLGDFCLFKALEKCNSPGEQTTLLKPAVELLPKFQFEAASNMDFSKCLGRKAFDKKAMYWDLNYFKYFFLKLKNIDFEEDKLERDFEHLLDLLSYKTEKTFMYRDFQSRNIMIFNSKYWFIDFQGGKSGPPQYDIISLLYQAKAGIDNSVKAQLIEHYIDIASGYKQFNANNFRKSLPAFILLRTLQVLGAYGFRGYYEKKPHFIDSIPYAWQNLRQIMTENKELRNLKELLKISQSIPYTPQINPGSGIPHNLCLHVGSFSYKKGIPSDPSGNGGGFVFDCRFLPNPGREEKYQNLTGNDDEVIEYFKQHQSVDEFIMAAFKIVEPAIENYIERGFQNLSVLFGCTGGQHRSVYCAIQFTKIASARFPHIRFDLQHQNL